eukprot:UN30960
MNSLAVRNVTQRMNSPGMKSMGKVNFEILKEMFEENYSELKKDVDQIGQKVVEIESKLKQYFDGETSAELPVIVGKLSAEHKTLKKKIIQETQELYNTANQNLRCLNETADISENIIKRKYKNSKRQAENTTDLMYKIKVVKEKLALSQCKLLQEMYTPETVSILKIFRKQLDERKMQIESTIHQQNKIWSIIAIWYEIILNIK